MLVVVMLTFSSRGVACRRASVAQLRQARCQDGELNKAAVPEVSSCCRNLELLLHVGGLRRSGVMASNFESMGFTHGTGEHFK